MPRLTEICTTIWRGWDMIKELESLSSFFASTAKCNDKHAVGVGWGGGSKSRPWSWFMRSRDTLWISSGMFAGRGMKRIVYNRYPSNSIRLQSCGNHIGHNRRSWFRYLSKRATSFQSLIFFLHASVLSRIPSHSSRDSFMWYAEIWTIPYLFVIKSFTWCSIVNVRKPSLLDGPTPGNLVRNWTITNPTI